MEWTRRQGRALAIATLVTIAVLTLARLSSFGIWDPWELSAADLARQLAETGTIDRPVLGPWLVARGFGLFGIHEWAGRLPLALAGLGAVALAYAGAARFAGRRAGVWAALVAGTSPLFLLNARSMLGAAPGFLASAGVFVCAMAAVFAPAPLRASDATRTRALAGWGVGLALSAIAAVLANGALVGLAPPLAAVGVAVLARRELMPPVLDSRRVAVAGGALAIALLVLGGVAYAIVADYAHFDYWTGGVPRGGDPPTWEMGIERLFHAFAPWSGVLPLALAHMLVGPPAAESSSVVRAPEERALRLGVTAWVAFGFLAQTLFGARYGTTTFLPLVGAAIAVALFLRDVERSGKSWPAAGLIAFLFVMLIARDFRAYPSGPVEGLPITGIEAPEDTYVKLAWAALLFLFAITLAMGLAVPPKAEAKRPWLTVSDLRDFSKNVLPLGWSDLRATFRGADWLAGERPSRFKTLVQVGAVFGGVLSVIGALGLVGLPPGFVRPMWSRSIGHRIWLVLAGLGVMLLAAFGVACWAMPDDLALALNTTSLAVKIGRVLVFLPFILGTLIFLGRVTLYGFTKLGSYRLAPALLAAVLIGGYTSIVYQPALSSHFSPREVYDTYNELARDGEPLGEYRVGGRAAAYYADGEIVELSTEAELIQFLTGDSRVWAAFRADDLASINRAYRRQAHRHLFVADARSERMILATNQPVEGRENENYLADAVLTEAPPIQHPVEVNFDDRIALLGYALELPHEGYVGPGEQFVITWYFRVNAPIGGSYQMFVHIDGPGQRIHGDHEPVQGRYPVRLWEPGDVVVDRQELRVPANYTRGALTIYQGFFAGDSRLQIKSGPSDGEDRARLGVLNVR